MTRITARGLLLGVLTTALLVVTPATAASAVTAAAPAAAPAAAALSASPDTDLADGQGITVTATGYPLNHSLDLVECVQDLGCDFGTLRVLFSGDSGGYVTTFFVSRILTIESGEVDCAVAQNCVLVSLDITDLSTGAQTSIAFDPNAPPLPDPSFHLNNDLQAHVRVDKGVARITGTVRCNQSMFIDLEMTLTQLYNQHIFRSDAFASVECTRGTATPYAVVFRPRNGLFDAGTATLETFGFANTGSRFVSRHQKIDVTLVASNR